MSERLRNEARRELAKLRREFLIADLVLEDALTRCVDESVDEDELVITLEQHRLFYETYMNRVGQYLTGAQSG